MPITLDGTNGITTPMYSGAISANAVTPSVNMKSRIINGGMTIDQRNAGASVTAGTTVNYPVDRFGVYGSQASKFTAQQSSTAPTGFSNSILITSSSAYSVTSSDIFRLQHYIEGFNTADLMFGTANAKTVTLSFWVRSSLTGTFGGSLMNSGTNRAYPFSYAISVADTWEQKSITIAGDTTGTWVGATNGIGLRIFWGLGVGSTYSGTSGAWNATDNNSVTGAVSVVGTNGATFYITGVQLEVGSTATSFDYRPYGTELALCYRYAWNYSSALSSNGSYLRYLSTRNASTTGVAGTLIFPVEMRTTPSLTTTGTASNYAVTHTGGNTACSTVPAIGGDGSSRFQVNLEVNVASGLTSGQGSQLMSNNNQTSFLLFSAEL